MEIMPPGKNDNATTGFGDDSLVQIPGCVQYVMNPTEGNTLKYDLFEYSEPIVRKIGLHVDQQKQK